DHVEADLGVELTVVVEPGQRQRADALLLGGVDRDRGAAVAGTATRLDLAEHDQPLPTGDDVELTSNTAPCRTPVAIDDLEPELLEVGGGAALAPVPACAVREVAAQNS